ncbi:MAG: HesA/MoeB/ThiF family protein [Chitinophagales bacterium]|nr:HesA/MoeB/ThiF family protein [Chitinophagales bacterium]MDW8428378.1 HesA/MoeB/ThiF family protein [Chitinophagales bacterium]
MLSDRELERYHRQLILPLVGVEGQRLLSQSSVAVVGAGGLGLPLLFYLAAAGVGRLLIVDGDVVERSNLHRQVWFTTDDVGSNKAEVAARQLRRLNPHIQVDYIKSFFYTTNGMDIVAHCDWVADCTDNFASHYQINDVCVKGDKPFLCGAVQAYQLQVAVLNRNGGGTYRCLYPEPPPPEQAPSCQQVGILNTVVGIGGMIMAHELLHLILNKPTFPQSYLLLADLTSYTFHRLVVPQDEWAVKSLKRQPLQHPDTYQRWCAREYSNQTVRELSAAELAQLQQRESVVLLDVREEIEDEKPGDGVWWIPFSELMRRAPEIPRQNKVVVCCSIGFRSYVAVQLLQHRFGFTNLYHLRGGLTSFRASHGDLYAVDSS